MNASPRQEIALRQVLKLIDLGCDLDRNSSDTAHARNDINETIAVLDQNVFEMFIRPVRYREAVETFYADVWSFTGNPAHDWRAYESQAALLTSEYLVARQLPGTKADTIYMTEFHWWELSDRVEKIKDELEERLSKDRSRFDKEVSSKLRIFGELFAPQKPNVKRSGYHDPTLQKDLENLGQKLHQSVLDRIQAARVATAELAESQIAEPYDQLRRVVAAPLTKRVRPLQSRFKPSREALGAIDAEAEDWFRSITDELKLPGHRERQRAIKSSGGALWNDARSIAYLRWVVKQRLDSHQRLVFITGDRVLFDTYRRWYFGPKGGVYTGEAFFMRRASQYCPLFNPLDSGGDLATENEKDAERSTLFALIQQAVEANLLRIFPDDMPVTQSSHAITDSRREKIALKQTATAALFEDEELAPLARSVSEGWIEQNTALIHRSRDLWQHLERLSIGASYDLVSGRVTEEQRAVAQRYVSLPDGESAKILSNYASTMLGELFENSIHLWVPRAQSFSDNMSYDPLWRRPPIKRISLAAALPENEKSELGVESRPEAVFMAATFKALERQDIGNAHRFASFALRAEELAALKGRRLDGFELEAKYLLAVANRLMITTVQAHLNKPSKSGDEHRRAASRAIDQLKMLFGRASALLTECISVHFPRIQESSAHHVRYLRTLSERASLHLFTATSLGLVDEAYKDLVEEDPKYYLSVARRDLYRCIEIDLDLNFEDPLLQAVRDQFIPNVAGYEVLARLLDTYNIYHPEQWPAGAINKLRTFWENERNTHALLNAELFGFYWLTKRPLPAGKRFDRRASWKSVTSLRLPLDRALFKAIYRRVLSGYL